MEVTCSIERVALAGEHGDIESVRATCSRCGHVTESYGTSERSIGRCLRLMRKECPEDENNYYVED